MTSRAPQRWQLPAQTFTVSGALPASLSSLASGIATT
jgi:hypothetical protein